MTTRISTQRSAPSALSLSRTSGRVLAGLATGVIALAGLTACEVDTFLDQSGPGRWEETPGTAPILERLAAIEGPATEPVEATKPRPEDLLPEYESYRLGPGDFIELTIQDLFTPGTGERIELDVDPRGFIDLPQAPGIFLDGKTLVEAQSAIAKALKERGILENAIVQVIIKSRRKLTYTIIGAIENPGQYQIGKPDLRLLEAFSAAGVFAEGSTPKIYVIRAVPLSDLAAGRVPEPGKGAAPAPGKPAEPAAAPTEPSTKPKEPIIDLIDELSGGKKDAPKKDDKPAPVVMDAQDGAAKQPAKRDPAIDLDDPSKKAAANGPGETNWAFVDGQWVQTGKKAAASTGDVVTQRVIEIPVAALMAGSAQYNIVIRPGDVIRIPALQQGLFYVGGQVARPGPYNLPTNGRVTLEKAIITAGNLSSLGVPERVDLTRMIGPDRQATIRLNFRAIKEKTQPDVFIRPDDVVDVGTNFWAFPLQVLRNGLRISYGFGFILDRNFGYDVFGPQQTTSL